MHVLITGATGFFGGHLAETFFRHGHHVVALVRDGSRLDHLQSLGVDLLHADLFAADRLRTGMRGIDVVIHAAARVEPFGRWSEFVTSTIEGTRQVLDAASAAGVPRVIYISTVGVYERPVREGIVFDETAPYGTPYRWRYYARAKIAAEQLVRAAGQNGSVATTIFRPTWLYGPRDLHIFSRTVAALRAGRVRWIGNGENTLNLVFVTDAANAVVQAATSAKSAGQIYNLANDESSPTQRQFITRICDLLDVPVPASSLPYRLAHNVGFLGECLAHATDYRIRPPITRLSVLLLGGHRRFSSKKLRTELDWQPQVDFETGLRATVDWYRSTLHAPHQP